MSNDSVISLEVSIEYTLVRERQGNHISTASRGKYGVHCAVTLLLLIYVLSSAVGQPVNHTP